MTKFTTVLILGVAAAVIGFVSAITEDEKNNIRAAAIPIIESCGPEYGVTKDDLLAAKQAKNPDAINPCFMACVFKKIGTINEQGLYDPAVAKEMHNKYIKGEDDLAKLSSISDICTSVNDQTVSDGPQGCERSKLLVGCMIENKSLNPFTAITE